MDALCAAGEKPSREECEEQDPGKLEEMIDAALGLPEPERSRLMPKLIALRAHLRGEAE